LSLQGVDSSRVGLPGMEQLAPLCEHRFAKNEVTWMSPQWYQCHQLDNTYSATDQPTALGDFCATIQCYK